MTKHPIYLNYSLPSAGRLNWVY